MKAVHARKGLAIATIALSLCYLWALFLDGLLGEGPSLLVLIIFAIIGIFPAIFAIHHSRILPRVPLKKN